MNNIYIRVKEAPDFSLRLLLLDNEDYVLVSLSQMLFLVEKKEMSVILHFIPGGHLTVLCQLRSEETISSALKCANTLLKDTNQISTTRRANVLRPV